MNSTRRRRSHHSSRNARLLLLSLGLCTFVLGGVLAVISVLGGNARLRVYAACYIMAAALFMSLRALLLELKQRRKRKVHRQRELRFTPEISE